MLQVHEHRTLEEAGKDLLAFALDPQNWVAVEDEVQESKARPVQHPSYQRRVGQVRICASVDVSTKLEVILRIAFRAQDLSPMKAADCLEDFLKARIPLVPNTEWQVEIDGRKWIHFSRRYTTSPLKA